MDKLDQILKELEVINSTYKKDGYSSHYIDFFVKEGKCEAVLSGNKAGLIYLAKNLLRLASKGTEGSHAHFDSINMLDECNCDLILKYKDIWE